MSVEDKKRLGRRFFKGYTKLVESKYWYNHYVALIFGASPASNLGSLIAIDWKGNELISVTRFFGNNDNVKLYLGSNPETNMYELWLGLIGLDGDGSEFIIQSRESIDLDSKTVETLPSYLKVISISWQKNNDFSELGELIGNATSNKSGLMSSGMVPLELSKDNNQYCKISVFMPNAGSINESVISVTNVGGDSFSVAVSMIRWNANKVFCKLINGTKISNINMYYTVDTERFCFYIKANWYAKIIVSRLGLVNTSKIESINAIPSGAIEVPISWRDKRYSTELGGLLPTNGIKRTKYYETIRLGASFSIGAPTNEFVYVSHNDGEMMVYIDSTGIVTKIFSSADEIISISLKDNQIMITAIYYDLIVTISVLSF